MGRGNRDKDKKVSLYKLTPRKTKNGYLRVYCRNSVTNKRQDLYIHRLVAEYFLSKVDGKLQVNHINCDRADNSVSNLEWCTPKENNQYTLTLGRTKRDATTGRFISGLNNISN